jgi:uncharacterized protein (TIGR02646 family)
MAVPAQYIFRINNAYIKTADDNAEITNDSALNLSWSDGYKTFKGNIRIYLKLAQNGRCAFCRCKIYTGTSWSNLEHLVSKTDYPQFKFTSENLVYCCTRCNMSKVKGNTLSNPNPIKTQQVFPNNSNGFEIVNPYYDDFQTHIDFIDSIIIVVANNSDKGRETIKLYKLYRPELAEDRASELQINQQTVNQQLMARLTSATIDLATIDQINAVIAQMPTWTL